MRVDIRFRVLGEIEVLADGRRVALPAGNVRSVLAALLLRWNRAVSVDELVDSVWGATQPIHARGAIQTYVMRLRKAFTAATGGERLVYTSASGYLIRVAPGHLDLEVFEELCEQADEAVTTGDLVAEEKRLQEALSLWRGPALTDVGSGRRYRDEAARLGEKRLNVAERLCARYLSAGRHERAIEQLRALTIEQPLRERLWYLLMVALYRSGRQAEALQTYSKVSRLLAEELGVDPGEDLSRLHLAVLNHRVDAVLEAPPVPAEQRPWTVQRQLPLARESIDLLAHMVGRHRMDADPAAARALADLHGGRPPAVRAAGAFLLDQPSMPVAQYVDMLQRGGTRTAPVADDGTEVNVRARIAASYELLSPLAQRLFHLLAVARGHGISSASAAVVLGTSSANATTALHDLFAAGLLQHGSNGWQLAPELLD